MTLSVILITKNEAERLPRCLESVRGLWAFVRTYIIRAGFLDGREGFLLAVANAETTYYRYLKLSYLYEASDVKRRMP